MKPPEVGQVLKSKWVFTKKKKSDGSIVRYKARTVACGNEQVYGRHYDVVFSAVVDMTVIKLLLAIVATWNVDAIHANAPNAYVQAELGDDYDLYMALPRGMRLTKEMLIGSKVDRGDDVVLKLRKSLNGLKQAGRLWSEFLYEKLEGAGFTRCVTGMCLYHKWMTNEVIVVGVYVDDLLLVSTRVELVSKLFGPGGVAAEEPGSSDQVPGYEYRQD